MIKESNSDQNSYLCPGCETPVHIPSGHAGQRVRCKHCDMTFRVPSHPFRLHKKNNVNCPICEHQITEEEQDPQSDSTEGTEPVSSNQTREKEQDRDPEAVSHSSNTVTCPSCDQALKAPSSVIGKRVRCKHCETLFKISESSTPSTKDVSDSSSTSTGPPETKGPETPEEQREKDQELYLYSCSECNHMYVVPDWLFGKQAFCGECKGAVPIEGNSREQQAQWKQRVSRGNKPTFVTSFSGWKMGPEGEFVPVLEESNATGDNRIEQYWSQLMSDLSGKTYQKSPAKKQEQPREKSSLLDSMEEDRDASLTRTVLRLLQSRAFLSAASIILLLSGIVFAYSLLGKQNQQVVDVPDSKKTARSEEDQSGTTDDSSPDLSKTGAENGENNIRFDEDLSGSEIGKPSQKTMDPRSYVPKNQYKRIIEQVKLLITMGEDPAPILYRIPPKHRSRLLGKAISSIWNEREQEPLYLLTSIRTFFPPPELEVRPPNFWIHTLIDLVQNHRLDPFTRGIALQRLETYVQRLKHARGNLLEVVPPGWPSVKLLSAQPALERHLKTLVKLAGQGNTFLSDLARDQLRSTMLGIRGTEIQGSYWFSFFLLEHVSSRKLRQLGLPMGALKEALGKLKQQNQSIARFFPKLRTILFSPNRSRKTAQKLVQMLEEALSGKQSRRGKLITHVMGMPGWNKEIHRTLFQPAFEKILTYIAEKGEVYVPFLEGAAIYALQTGNQHWYSRTRSVLVKNKEELNADIRRDLFLRFGDQNILKQVQNGAANFPNPVFPSVTGDHLTTNKYLTRYVKSNPEKDEWSSSETLFKLRSEIWMHILNPSLKTNVSLKKGFDKTLEQDHQQMTNLILQFLSLKKNPGNMVAPLLERYLDHEKDRSFFDAIARMMMLSLLSEDYQFRTFWNMVEEQVRSKYPSNLEQQNQLLVKMKKRLLRIFFRCFPEKAKTFVRERYDQFQKLIRNEILNIIANRGLYDLAMDLTAERDQSFVRNHQSFFMNLFGLQADIIKHVVRDIERSGKDIEQESLSPKQLHQSWLTDPNRVSNWIQWLVRNYGDRPEKVSQYIRSYTTNLRELQDLSKKLTRSDYQKTAGKNIRKTRNFFAMFPKFLAKEQIQNIEIKTLTDLAPDKSSENQSKSTSSLNLNLPPENVKSGVKWTLIRPDKSNLTLVLDFIRIDSRWKLLNITVQ